MSSAFPRPTISAANGCAIIAAFPLNRLHNRMRPIDADRVYTSTAQVALTILLQNGDPMLIVELTRLLLQWLWCGSTSCAVSGDTYGLFYNIINYAIVGLRYHCRRINAYTITQTQCQRKP